MRRPDIVLLVLDTQRADRLSCYGHKPLTSPRLDELAGDATLFKRAVAPAQWTVPTHASMFTGLYPSQHTTFQMDSVLPGEIQTLAERLQLAGYYTAGFSHNPLIGLVKNGLRRGFHSFTNYDYLGAGLLTVHLSRPGQKSRSARHIRRAVRFLLAELLGYHRKSPVSRLAPLLLPIWKSALRLRGGSKQIQAERSLAAASQLQIERIGLDRDQSIFTFINLMGVHVPYDPPRLATRRFLVEKLGWRATNALLQRMNNLQVNVDNWLGMTRLEEEYKAILDAFYNAEVYTQDALVGDYLGRLTAAGLLDNTLLVVVADHGDHLGEKRRVNHTFGVYEELTHVPLIIRDPSGALPRQQVSEPFVSTRRIYHTALTAAGVASPGEESLSLARVGQEDGRDAERGAAFAEAHPLQWAIQRIEKRRPGLVKANGYERPARAICAGKYKLITTGEQRTELFAVRDDPAESQDISEDHPEIVAALRSRLEEFVERAQPVSESSTQAENDPSVQKRLQALGYLE